MFYTSRPVQPPSPRGPTHRLSVVRYLWSDIKLVSFCPVPLPRLSSLMHMQQWKEIKHILQLNSSSAHPTPCCLGTLRVRETEQGNPITADRRVARVRGRVRCVCGAVDVPRCVAWELAQVVLGRGGKGLGAVRLEGDEDFSLCSASIQVALYISRNVILSSLFQLFFSFCGLI
jgi:hypothetical protein